MNKYLIATHNTLSGLEDEVNEKIDKGYTPIGIVGLSRYGVGQMEKIFYQPMVLATLKRKD